MKNLCIALLVILISSISIAQKGINSNQIVAAFKVHPGSFENKIYETQKKLIDKHNLSKKDWQKLLEEKKISQTTDSFIFDCMAQNISLNPDQENIFKSLQINKSFLIHNITLNKK